MKVTQEGRFRGGTDFQQNQDGRMLLPRECEKIVRGTRRGAAPDPGCLTISRWPRASRWCWWVRVGAGKAALLRSDRRDQHARLGRDPGGRAGSCPTRRGGAGPISARGLSATYFSRLRLLAGFNALENAAAPAWRPTEGDADTAPRPVDLLERVGRGASAAG